MRVPIEWLHQYCAPALDVNALADRLAMTGTEVERIERHGVGALENFVVGKVLEAGPHPDADRLSVCVVDVGRRRTATDRVRRAERGGRPDRRRRQTRRRDARRDDAAQGQASRAVSPTG